MNTVEKKINTAIIDDNEGFIFSLKEHLSFFPEIEMCGCASHYKQARKIFEMKDLDLVFLDIEMPIKNGFELLQEVRDAGKNNFKVVFYTIYDKYLINALRESAFDYLIKPVKQEELKQVIERYKLKDNLEEKLVAPTQYLGFSEIISLPTITGIRFVDKNNILYIHCTNSSPFEKKCWQVVLTDRSQIKLRTNTSAKDILDFIGNSKFIRINPTCIINISYLAAIEFSNRECQLIPPYNDIILIASRSNMIEIRNRFDIL